MRTRMFITVTGCLLASLACFGQDTLRGSFLDPPPSARPRVWWHWMNGNITKEGIQLDLEWLKRVGIGGQLHPCSARNTRRGRGRGLAAMLPECRDPFRHPPGLEDRLGLERT